MFIFEFSLGESLPSSRAFFMLTFVLNFLIVLQLAILCESFYSEKEDVTKLSASFQLWLD
jgi:hypothetical protein